MLENTMPTQILAPSAQARLLLLNTYLQHTLVNPEAPVDFRSLNAAINPLTNEIRAQESINQRVIMELLQAQYEGKSVQEIAILDAYGSALTQYFSEPNNLQVTEDVLSILEEIDPEYKEGRSLSSRELNALMQSIATRILTHNTDSSFWLSMSDLMPGSSVSRRRQLLRDIKKLGPGEGFTPPQASDMQQYYIIKAMVISLQALSPSQDIPINITPSSRWNLKEQAAKKALDEIDAHGLVNIVVRSFISDILIDMLCFINNKLDSISSVRQVITEAPESINIPQPLIASLQNLITQLDLHREKAEVTSIINILQSFIDQGDNKQDLLIELQDKLLQNQNLADIINFEFIMKSVATNTNMTPEELSIYQLSNFMLLISEILCLVIVDEENPLLDDSILEAMNSVLNELTTHSEQLIDQTRNARSYSAGSSSTLYGSDAEEERDRTSSDTPSTASDEMDGYESDGCDAGASSLPAPGQRNE